MKRLLFAASLIFVGLTGMAQQCNCPNSEGDDRVTSKTFHFSNGKDMVLCGFITTEGDDISYTQFSISVCGDSKPIETWDASMTCKVEQDKDALLVKEMYNLPVGQSFSTLWRPFYIHKFTFTGGKVNETEYYNKELAHYNKDQIAAVIKQYNELPSTSNEETMKVANMLFWATVSGNTEAEGLLNSIPGKFGPFDNVIGQEWKAIQTVYNRWKERKK